MMNWCEYSEHSPTFFKTKTSAVITKRMQSLILSQAQFSISQTVCVVLIALRIAYVDLYDLLNICKSIIHILPLDSLHFSFGLIIPHKPTLTRVLLECFSFLFILSCYKCEIPILKALQSNATDRNAPGISTCLECTQLNYHRDSTEECLLVIGKAIDSSWPSNAFSAVQQNT